MTDDTSHTAGQPSTSINVRPEVAEALREQKEGTGLTWSAFLLSGDFSEVRRPLLETGTEEAPEQ